MKVRKGDEVVITIGKDKGKRGKIEKVLTKENKVIVAGMNQYKRHVKARTQTQKSEIVTIIKPLAVSNVMPICSNCNQPTRIGFEEKNRKKMRICRKCSKEI
ncbi:MAG: 50S ribosomal protein L24 [Candidatus Levybacteria bacterium RIFCSPHIGHO2_12_FULL_38_12]|nr:MAG: 50S ribosomal protein L24 [Candidatus Levybacteria bacterium RIFCSPHIGHO2_01_FULL_38_12]OGH21963.1 MAG: 50S ribosomal protein L24 [Candidatus Levybacteria bacterium RIFCSPHIGHO2_02_FULL_37_18]OGH23035.1 MAG: 50S ribosomal protein L24 [Candidatus Levybacteria bacterium RIFCSPHIGHO2_12_FULL_38_12]OGH33656.1 MAG: 50S ribosomal protein L24 [Candidatus Levybacteria bacterium RIFCSPLOWO2_01_FULL_37_20]OGH44562.1 MAG: 50S ribosomal protein L24 [Candidatus Levybacteria bacterium RIFCSPLOWO2_02_